MSAVIPSWATTGGVGLTVGKIDDNVACLYSGWNIKINSLLSLHSRKCWLINIMSLETRLTNWKRALFVKVLSKVNRFASCIPRVMKEPGIIETDYSNFFVVFSSSWNEHWRKLGKRRRRGTLLGSSELFSGLYQLKFVFVPSSDIEYKNKTVNQLIQFKS